MLDVAAAYCAAAHEVEGQRSSFDALTTSLLAVGDWPALFALGSNTLERAPSWIQKAEVRVLQARAWEHMQLDSLDAQRQARDLIARANTALANSEPEVAVDYLEQASAVVDDAWVSARHGQVLVQLGRSIEAERAFSRARAQLRQLGTPPTMSLPDRHPRFGWDGRRTNACPGCDIKWADFTGKNFAGADLRGAHLFMIVAPDSNFRGANLTGGALIGNLQRADLRDMVVHDGSVEADLDGADLRGSIRQTRRG